MRTEEKRLSPDSMTKSKRIASNTLVLFMRMMAIMVINLYAVRVILKGLGVVDYGIYNAVAGVVLTSTFLNTTLAVSIQRFYSYSIGENNQERLHNIFSVSLKIVILLSIVILLLFETVGLWFVETTMIEPAGKIPVERLQAAVWAFHFALFTFVLSILQLPYTAAIFAHEDMRIYAIISLLECLARLVVAFFISKVMADGLIFYGAGLLAVALMIFCSYALTGRHRYPECHYKKITDKKLYRELLSFSGWTMYGAMAGVGIIQGTNILLAIFFGPLVVASYAIANQIYNASNSLCNSVVLAFRPAMVKSYAERQHQYLGQLFNVGNKALLYLLTAVVIPLITEMRTILQWWINDANENTVLFSRLILIMMVILAMHNPITTIIQSTGRVRNYYLTVDTMTISCIPLTYILFKSGLPSYWAFISMIFICLLAHVFRLICLKKVYPLFSYLSYMKSLVIPALMIILASSAFAISIHQAISHPGLRFITVFVLSPCLTLLLVYLIGINRQEKILLSDFIKSLIKH